MGYKGVNISWTFPWCVLHIKLFKDVRCQWYSIQTFFSNRSFFIPEFKKQNKYMLCAFFKLQASIWDL